MFLLTPGIRLSMAAHPSFVLIDAAHTHSYTQRYERDPMFYSSMCSDANKGNQLNLFLAMLQNSNTEVCVLYQSA